MVNEYSEPLYNGYMKISYERQDKFNQKERLEMVSTTLAKVKEYVEKYLDDYGLKERTEELNAIGVKMRHYYGLTGVAVFSDKKNRIDYMVTIKHGHEIYQNNIFGKPIGVYCGYVDDNGVFRAKLFKRVDKLR